MAIVIAGAACTSAAPSSDRSAATAAPGTSVVAHPVDDEVTPLIVTTVGGDPIPVKGSDDKFHVAYELSVLNYHPYPAVITSLDTVARDGKVVTSLSGEQVRANTIIVPNLSTLTGAPASGIPPGGTGLLVLEDVYPDRASIPPSVTHRIAASFNPPDDASDPTGLFPSSVTQTAGPMTISTKDPVVLGAPVAGPGWATSNGCCDGIKGFHRAALLPIGGAINGTERFGIDFGRVTADISPGTTLSHDMVVKPGTDGTKNEDYLGYGAPLLAVADATVVQVVADVADTPIGGRNSTEGLTLHGAGGNTVVLQLAPDLFAYYLHNAPGSTTVKAGDKVIKGQQIAQLGSSGNSAAPHLHFQLGRSPQAYSAENVPYVFDSFVLKGTVTDAGDTFVAEPPPGPRQAELPLRNNVVGFPSSQQS